MTDYRGYQITHDPIFFPGGWITELTYTIRRDGRIVHEGNVDGVFDGLDAAAKAVDAAARQWIDQQGS